MVKSSDVMGICYQYKLCFHQALHTIVLSVYKHKCQISAPPPPHVPNVAEMCVHRQLKEYLITHDFITNHLVYFRGQ